MELYAAGFNAWNQLSFNDSARQPEENEPRDLFSFQKILEGKEVEKPIARLSYTIARRDGTLVASGFGLEDNDTASLEFLSSSAESVPGQILALDSASGCIGTYPSFTSWRSGSPATPLPCDVPVKQVAAYDAGFSILHRDGTVSTFGDPRFPSSLGRDISPSQSAHSPAPVPDINDLNDPVSHITAGGLTVAALTASGSVYVWGTPSQGTHRRRQPFPRATGIPNYVPVDGDKDVRDVALGESHAIALTTDGCVYVIGGNGNGQLGLAGDAVGRAVEEEWTRVSFEVRPGWEVVGVAAGPRASFIITSRKTVSSAPEVT